MWFSKKELEDLKGILIVEVEDTKELIKGADDNDKKELEDYQVRVEGILKKVNKELDEISKPLHDGIFLS